MKKLLIALLLLTGAAFAQTETVASNFGGDSGRGIFKIYTCTNPAANTEVTCTVPTGKIWRIVSMRVVLVTDANVANRITSITCDDGTTVFYQTTAATAQTAGTTFNYNFDAVENSPVLNTTTSHLPVPFRMLLGPGYRIKTSTSGIQAGDDYGAAVLLVEEWVK
jgi:hypothetical protein